MRTNIVTILKRQGLARKMAGTPVVLKWQFWTVGWTTDPVTGRRVGTSAPQTETVMAFVHFVGGSTVVRQNAEIAVGDVIVDFAPDVTLEGRDGLTFEIAGVRYGEKKINGVLTMTWDAMVLGQKLGRSLLLQLAT